MMNLRICKRVWYFFPTATMLKKLPDMREQQAKKLQPIVYGCRSSKTMNE